MVGPPRPGAAQIPATARTPPSSGPPLPAESGQSVPGDDRPGSCRLLGWVGRVGLRRPTGGRPRLASLLLFFRDGCVLSKALRHRSGPLPTTGEERGPSEDSDGAHALRE